MSVLGGGNTKGESGLVTVRRGKSRRGKSRQGKGAKRNP